MSRLEKIIKFKFLIILLILPAYGAFGRTVGMISSVKGNAFLLKDGKATALKAGVVIEENNEIITEEGAEVTFTDYFDHRFHLSGGGHLKASSPQIQLVGGYLWIQSYNTTDEAVIQTANSLTSFIGGEAVLSFDPVSGKSQLLSINGDFYFSNLIDKHLKLELKPGEFSFVDNEYNKGIPRKATKIGYNSYQKVVGNFNSVKPMASYSTPFPKEKKVVVDDSLKREIASLGSSPVQAAAPIVNPVPAKKSSSKILFLGSKSKKAKGKVKRLPASWVKKKKRWKRKANPYSKKSNVEVKVFGKKYLSRGHRKARGPASVKKAKRMPASVARQQKSPYVEMPAIDVFEDSMVDQYKKQMRHSKEVNSLIDELKNYSSDYSKDY